jgi:NADH dehydrogenase FAD-containing subunit
MRKQIVIIGSSFAGYTTALELKKQLRDEHDITVLSRGADFIFVPALIWLPFGKRTKADISFALGPIYAERQIAFVHTTATRIDLERRVVEEELGEEYPYDYLVIATGPENDWGAVQGLGPYEGFTQSIFGVDDADRCRVALRQLLESPGPAVVGAVQGASCLGATYEFLLSLAAQLKRHGLRDKVPLTYLTAEPFLTHLGVGGFGNARHVTETFLAHEGITALTDVEVKRVRPGELELAGGRTLPFSFAMLAPPQMGAQVVRACTAITDDRGFVKVTDRYQTERYPEVFAAGAAAGVATAARTRVPLGVPKTGYLSEEMAKVVAHNIVADIYHAPKISLAPESIDAKGLLDAGEDGIISSEERLARPEEQAWALPGPEAHWARLAYEKYFLTARRHGIL